jgi:peptidoglycan-N-acetylglucosamine deacetylase
LGLLPLSDPRVKISLSFDNGPYPEVTPRVLDTLAEYDVTASFFVLGSKIGDPTGLALVSRAKSEGHRIGNHTFSHSVLFGVAEDQTRPIWEIDTTQALLGTLGDERLFRPFGGGALLDKTIMSTTAYNHLRRHNYTCVLWNCIPRDYEDPVGWVNRALADVRINPWTVIVVHDIPTGAMDVLNLFLRKARDIGGEFVSEFPEAVTPLLAGEELWSMQRRDLLADL